ncbi:MAG: OmcA/MtrC family decaheme c-type cytochrome [Acidobacteria bacterium]|nr:OmcA/MtrC family decaheme c-type cytochrome [Acidobacteriota bacterium]
MKGRKVVIAFLGLLLLGVGLTIAGDGPKPTYQPSDKAYYLTDAQLSWIRPGLKLTIQKVEFAPPSVQVTFRIADDADQGLDRLGIQTPGAVSASFVIARIKPGDTQFTNYNTRIQTSPITGVSATQATTDSGGTFTSLGDGVYRYTMGLKLPADFEVDATHRVGIFSRRTLTEFGFDTNAFVANAILDFVPSGNPVTQVRDVVRTEACNQCHNPLGLHGGVRRDTRLCVTCHQPQSTDPDTSNTVDFKVMIHKIHRGANLPSVVAGTPYQIIGFNQSVLDFSEIHWPQDVRNCTTCHQGGAQSDNWKNNPSRVACGSCHDDVNFATGEHHPGGVQVDDSKCSICHPADTGIEFDLSVAGVHTIPAFSKQLPGLNVKILEITNTKPGDKPTVSFTVTDNAGKTIAPLSGLSTLALRLAGPTSDYTWHVSEDARTATATPSGYTYTFRTNGLPANAKGSYAVGAEARRSGVAIPGPLLGQSFSATESIALNPVHYFSVDGSAVQLRRQVVDVQTKCNVCHKKLVMHGGTRTNTQYCILCHNPAAVDNPEGARAAGRSVPEGTVPTSINFRFLIHRWHTGHDLNREFTIYRTNGIFSPNEEVHFPGDRRDCSKCHVGNSYMLPLPSGMANAVAPREFYSPLGPAASACLGCHDSEPAAAHAYLMTAPFGESCAVCHGEGADFAVSKVHAR